MFNNRYREDRKKWLNILPEFATISESKCGESLGSIEPVDYPADYMVDEYFPVTNIETNVTHIEYDIFLSIFF